MVFQVCSTDFIFHSCRVGLRGGLLPAGEDWSSAGYAAGASGDRKRAEYSGLPHQHARSFLAGIPGEGEYSFVNAGCAALCM